MNNETPSCRPVAGHNLRPGMVVCATGFEDWEPGCDEWVTVKVWDWEDGESLLAGPNNSWDNNVLDYPTPFSVRCD